MTSEQFISLIENPETVKKEQLTELREIVELYPYFSAARLLYLKALQLSAGIHTEAEINRTVLYVPDKKWLFYYLYPERKLKPEHTVRRSSKYTGSYFDLLDAASDEEDKTENSLKKIAEKIKASRLEQTEKKDYFQTTGPLPVEKVNNQSPAKIEIAVTEKTTLSEEQVKQLIKEKKYREAIEILENLNLIYPKKSIYFADQIRFLKKVIENS